MGSADWMHRNMHGRVEVITPIYHEEIIKQCRDFLNILIQDQRNAWDLLSDGSYKQRAGADKTSTHLTMMTLALDELQKQLNA